MKRWSNYLLIILVAAGGIGLFSGLGLRKADAVDEYLPRTEAAGDQSQQILEDYRLMRFILEQVGRNYYEEVDVHDIAIAGLKGMMSVLDPYSDFFVEEQDQGVVADLEITTTGTYSGIGATIGYTGGQLSIVAPMKGSPALNAGLQPGDVIAAIDGTPSRTFSTARAASLIKGPEGTEVTLLIDREGIPELMEFTITRAEIEVNDVSAAIFAEPGIAYVEIARFSAYTGQFLEEALSELATEQPIEGLILDLRGNPGGLLDQALAVAEPFLPPGEVIVSTRGRIDGMNAEFRSRNDQLYDGRMAVLVNVGSASASEIVAGAVQDLDRGIIVGENTWGKGLVQSVAEIIPDHVIRLTTGQYFTPSGRNIQRPFVRDASGNLVPRNPNAPDTTDHPTFASRNGRLVTGGGGIVPDIEAEGITGNLMLYALKFRQSMFLRYVNNYVNTHNIAEGTPITVTDAILDDFREWSIDSGFTYESPTEMVLNQLLETAEAENMAEALADEIENLRRAIDREEAALWAESREGIALELRREFATKQFGYEQGQLVYMQDDDQFQAALEILRDSGRYAGMLSGPQGSGADTGGGH